MPWQESHRVIERMKFVTRLNAGERMSDLCREFGISRKTGYKIWERFGRLGPEGLLDMSRRPHFCHSRIRPEIERLALELKKERPTWGSKKIVHYLKVKQPGVKLPSHSTIHEVFLRNGLVKPRNHRKTLMNAGTGLTVSRNPNDVWCADFKGQFRLGNRQYCYPLTITDHMSRYLIRCEALENVKTEGTRIGFEAAFKEYGLPRAILSDNGPPFGCVGLFGLSALSVWWMRLGIEILRIEPGHPEQNGRHERMHLTLKQATIRPAASNSFQQQERFDSFKHEYNRERPHESLHMSCPTEFYQPSDRAFPKELNEPEYPFHDFTCRVAQSGGVKFRSDIRFHLGMAFAGQTIGLREEDMGIWRVSFLNYDLGLFDRDRKIFEPFQRLLAT